ncbi:MAG: copper-binding protein, partial [Vicinamibacteria bacterium]|nr:copper-binding protein [Vicinamibacteria bacterium]
MRRSAALLALCASGCATAYDARGLVLRVDPASSTLTVSHDPIIGYMGAMVMPFAVSDRAALRGVRP